MRCTYDDGSMFILAENEGGDLPPGELLSPGGHRPDREHPPRRRVASAVTLPLAIVTAFAAIGVFAVVGSSSSPSAGQTQPVRGEAFSAPSAGQLAAGRWRRTPLPPIYFAFPSTVWDGSALVAVEGKAGLPAQAAAYDPSTNRWNQLAHPPKTVGTDPIVAWGGGRLVAVARETGLATSWRPQTDRWAQLPGVPVSGVASLVWDGQEMLATTVGSGVRAFILEPHRWVPLAALPQPARGTWRGAAAVVDDGVVYVLATGVRPHHRKPVTGFVELLRLDSRGWTRVPGTAGLALSQISLVPLDGAVLVTGSVCPEQVLCPAGYYVASLIRPGRTAGVTPLRPPIGAPYPGNITGGGSTVVVCELSRPCWIYNLKTLRWLRGPRTRAAIVASGVYWTPDGVVTGGDVLRPTQECRGEDCGRCGNMEGRSAARACGGVAQPGRASGS
jgi:hypothetical protein